MTGMRWTQLVVDAQVYYRNFDLFPPLYHTLCFCFRCGLSFSDRNTLRYWFRARCGRGRIPNEGEWEWKWQLEEGERTAEE